MKWRTIFHVSNHRTYYSVRINVYQHVYIKPKKWNNKYNIYVIFHDAKKESTEHHTRTNVWMHENLNTNVRLWIRLGIRLQLYANYRIENASKYPIWRLRIQRTTFSSTSAVFSLSKPEKCVYVTHLFVCRQRSWNGLTISLLAIACKWMFILTSFPIEWLRTVECVCFILLAYQMYTYTPNSVYKCLDMQNTTNNSSKACKYRVIQ